jgi:hypothetical protein
MYYVEHNACETLEDAEQVQFLYRMAGQDVDIITEAEYFQEQHWRSMVSVMRESYHKD